MGGQIRVVDSCQYPRNVGIQHRVEGQSQVQIYTVFIITIFLSLAHPNLVLLPILGPQEGLRPPKSTAQNSRL